MAQSSGKQTMERSAPVVLATDNDKYVVVTPVVLNNDAYDSGDLLFDSVEIPEACRVMGGETTLISAVLIDTADQKVAMTLVFANALTDFGAPDSAPDPDDTEALTILGKVSIAASDYIDLGGASFAHPSFTPFMMKAADGTTSLYVAAVNGTGTPTYATGCLTLKLGFFRS